MMMPDPQTMAQVQAVTNKITATIEIDYTKGSVTLALESKDLQAQASIANLLGQLANGLATQLQAFFAIQGEIVEIK